MNEFKIDTSEKFEHLPRAPIIEAVLDIRARADAGWEETFVSARLKAQVQDYPTVEPQSTVQAEFSVMPGQIPFAQRRDIGWSGLVLKSGDGLQIAQFKRDGFTFSRLQPYEDWERLKAEALRLWRIHAALSKPMEIQRIGLRFINRIDLPLNETRFEDYIQPHPSPPRGLDLPFVGFLHAETLAVPGHPYAINLVRTIQSPQPPLSNQFALIIDTDVSTIQPIEHQEDWFDKGLDEMRWLKNKVFFGSMTEKAIQKFK
jgi:uncharacterized protein (TIGR04255 family)